MEFPLDILLTIISVLYKDKKENLNQNSQELEWLFEVVLPLQGNEDAVVRQKATQFIATLIDLKILSTKGRWVVTDRPGVENYRNFLKLTERKAEKDLLERLRFV